MLNDKLKIEFAALDYEPSKFDNETHPRIQVRPMYFEQGFSSTRHIYGRRAVLNRLLKALAILPAQYGFLIWDVYRPRAVQAKLFVWMKEQVRNKYPQLNDQQIEAEAKKYASPPSKIGEVHCPPHLSGGAIDLTLYEIATGQAVEMGTPFDDCTERAHRDYFEQAPQLSQEEDQIKINRRLLRSAMENVGFTSYHYEWWHYDIGDILWSRVTGHPTVFGPLFGDIEWPTETTV